MGDFMTPAEFEQTYPGRPPEKYLFEFACLGVRREEDGSFAEQREHAMVVVFNWNYPGERPKFIWLTPIWHPNFSQPYICLEGHPLSVGLKLAYIVPEVARMIQYQSHNVHDPMDRDAAAWAEQNMHHFPLDRRDVLDGRRILGQQPAPRLVQFELQQVTMQHPELLVELVEADEQQGKGEK